ncbi:PQQ-dependent sugar dehydrogenase [Jiulongibacter sediminis]|uniref:PQQ-dependent sugar dehydrogenase n=1 Tax=Jiulongibacter sediminis TaxID=1605367 RepID=UPI0006DC8A0F|nr:PQQ-dependent sugar dehydrogenase [Jiulongibacter sediminis]TBX26504.1 PKD domain-containing protein [Jiulongibacter sediminis]
MKKIILACAICSVLFTACESGPKDDPNVKPEDNRFTEVTLAQGLDEPMEMTFLPGSKILIAERKGGLKLVNEETRETLDAGFISVNTKYTNKEGRTREAEEGLMGVIADPNFEENNWIYLYYADPDTPKHVLARYEFKDDYLVEDSKIVVLEVKTQREECCHTGGGMTWDTEGNLFLTVGNNTVNPRSGASNMNEAEGHKNEDDQRAPGNSNDLRGKILRITPQADGSYTIPEGNLFPEGTEKTRPEIYTMGHRNPWRVSYDTKTGYIYWGEVGPDANVDSIWGPKGYDEFNQAKKAGFFGWPYVIGNNFPYNRYNSEDGTYGEPFDPMNLKNNSVNNTGIVDLPEPVPAMLYYPYGPSQEFPLLGTSGRSATGGPVYRKADFKNAERPWPSYYEGKWLITDFMRGWIMAITMDENGDYESMEQVLPNNFYSGAIDMDFGPSGDMYVLEYGTAWFRGNPNSRLVKIEYNAGNRKPIVEAAVDKTSGQLPLKVNLSAEGTMDYDDYDQGNLNYSWIIKEGGVEKDRVSGEKVEYTFTDAGDYEVELEVTDSKGDMNSKTLNVFAGNSAPQLSITLDKPNKTFYFGEKQIGYSIAVTDSEDGSTENGAINADEVSTTFDFVPAGFDPIEMAANHATEDELASFSVGRQLIEGSDCISCHQFDSKSIGPSYAEVAERYPNTPKNRAYLIEKVINGGSGVWGEHGMSAHPDLSRADAARMVDFILNMNSTASRLPLSGSVNAAIPDYEESGSFVLRAAYKDRGASNVKPLLGEEMIVLRSPFLEPHSADFRKSTVVQTASRNAFYAIGDGSSIGFADIDLTGIKEIVLYVSTGGRAAVLGGTAELHFDDPDGAAIATSEKVGMAPDQGFRRPPAGMSFTEFRRQNAMKLNLSIPEGTEGKHSVYFKFKNPDAGESDFVFQIQEIEFRQ